MNHLYNQIVLFGDSITQGAELSQAYVRKLDVYNRGFSGYNTEWAKELLTQLLPNHDSKEQSQNSNRVKIVLIKIFFGANDAALKPNKQHIDLDKYKENLTQMVNMVKKSDSESPPRVILITPPPLDEEAWWNTRGMEIDRKSEVTHQYALACLQVAQELNVPV
ncbi:1467_t:CDS:2, partial [Acaulospora morrowiae]